MEVGLETLTENKILRLIPPRGFSLGNENYCDMTRNIKIQYFM